MLSKILPVFALVFLCQCTSPNWGVRNQTSVQASIEHIQRLEQLQDQLAARLDSLRSHAPSDTNALRKTEFELATIQRNIEDENAKASLEMSGLQGDYQAKSEQWERDRALGRTVRP